MARASVESAVTAALVAAIALGFFVRGFHVLSSDFPLNDGGMFYAMARDLQHNAYRLPEFTTYNSADIPFTYPPLGFYASALLDDLTPLSLIQVFRWLPLVATCLTVPAFYLLARSMLPSRIAVVAAVLAFALVPRSFMWLLMGGGVTRSLGFLFAILALYFVHRLYAKTDRRALPWAMLLSALTVLSHLETGWFLAFSIGLFFLAFARNRRGIEESVVLATGTLVLTAVWWVPVFLMHGLEPLTTVFGTGGSIFSGGAATRDAYLGLLRLISTSEPLFPLIGVLAAFGALACIATRRYFLPVWWAAIILLDVRAFPTFTCIPVAMMAGICVHEVLLPMLSNGLQREPATPNRPVFQQRLTMSAVIGAFVIFALASALLRSSGLGGEASNLRGLSDEELAALEWVKDETPAGSTFLVMPDSSWETAKTAEWFPVLAGRTSIATVQGTEWLANGGFKRTRDIFDDAYRCGYQTSECLDLLATENRIAFDYVYIRKGDLGQCCTTLLASLESDDGYQRVYDDEGASIFLRKDQDGPSVRAPQ
ncbi:MAG: glycosyltransferase family 39 protein [Dehalococcoidia bacterium]